MFDLACFMANHVAGSHQLALRMHPQRPSTRVSLSLFRSHSLLPRNCSSKHLRLSADWNGRGPALIFIMSLFCPQPPVPIDRGGSGHQFSPRSTSTKCISLPSSSRPWSPFSRCSPPTRETSRSCSRCTLWPTCWRALRGTRSK